MTHNKFCLLKIIFSSRLLEIINNLTEHTQKLYDSYYIEYKLLFIYNYFLLSCGSTLQFVDHLNRTLKEVQLFLIFH